MSGSIYPFNFGYEHFYVPVRVATTTPVAMSGSDKAICVLLGTPGAVALSLYPSPLEGREVLIKDGAGNAGTYNITISTTDSTTIDGASTLVISSNYGHTRLIFNGTQWNAY
jgi:hypothetical protein